MGSHTIREMKNGGKDGTIEIRGFTEEEIESIVRNKPHFTADIHAVVNSYLQNGKLVPEEGREFELRCASVIDPLHMIHTNGNACDGWRFTGTLLTPQIGRFKLVRVGYCFNLQEVKSKLRRHGLIPKGQWREVFKETFSAECKKNDDLIGFADDSWIDPADAPSFPVLDRIGKNKTWYPAFGWATHSKKENWLWLVQIE